MSNCPICGKWNGPVASPALDPEKEWWCKCATSDVVVSQRSEEKEPLLPFVWRDGAPRTPWSTEWFVAETTYGDRVVLTALPEGYSYDFKTADETYIRRDKIRRWAQFPDSQFIAAPLT